MEYYTCLFSLLDFNASKAQVKRIKIFSQIEL